MNTSGQRTVYGGDEWKLIHTTLLFNYNMYKVPVFSGQSWRRGTRVWLKARLVVGSIPTRNEYWKWNKKKDHKMNLKNI